MSPESTNGHVVEKALDEDALKKSVQVVPNGQSAFYNDAAASLFFLATMADEIEPWGRGVKLRDRQLRDFIPVESMFSSALGIVAARNASFSWKIDGPNVDKMQRILQLANFGAGWQDLVIKTTIDLSTQDSGAFWEIIRAGNSADAELLGIAHMDAARCYPTGVPEAPVLYMDRNNKYHLMKWYQVVHLREMPATYEGLPGLQYCALTRLMTHARMMRDIAQFYTEKIGGRNTRSITAVRGMTASSIEEALQKQNFNLDAMGRTRLGPSILVSSVDPKAEIGFETLDFASIPDGFDQAEMLTWYITIMAMAFLTDYQEFAPLASGNLGTSTQSQVLHAKSRGKGPGLFMKTIANAINWSVIPEDDEFMWDEQDADADALEATTKKTRAEARAARITSTEITKQVARQIAVEEGDLTPEQLEELAKQDEEQEAKEQEQADRDAEQFNQRFPPQQDPNTPNVLDDNGTPAAQNSLNDDTIAEEEKAVSGIVDDARAEQEAEFEAAMDAAFARTLESLRSAVGTNIVA